jgi:phosphatidate cytidylyltransferase
MALDLATFNKRALSAVVFVAIMFVGLLWNQWSFLLLVTLIESLCISELIALQEKINDYKTPQWLMLTTIALGLSLTGSFYWSSLFPHATLSLLPIWLGLALILFVASLLLKEAKQAITLQLPLILLYIGLPFISLVFLFTQHHLLPMLLIACIWINDTMAYIIGSFIGKTPFSSISPKKTWEGTLGGGLLCVATAWAVAYFFAIGIPTSVIIVFAIIAATFGTLGDLIESKLKRMANVKDSGAIMPGHGGALDRFDSLLLAAPFAALFIYYFFNHSTFNF